MLRSVFFAVVTAFLLVPPASAQELMAGQAAYNSGAYMTAFSLLRPLAEKGDPRAQNDLGVMYRNGHGVTRDDGEAVTWFRKAAEQGYSWAQNNLAVMYRKGQGVPQNYKQAMVWSHKAAGQGHARAQNNLAVMYLEGQGVPQDDEKALAWFRKAASQGYDRAQRNLDFMLAKGRGGVAAPSKNPPAPVAVSEAAPQPKEPPAPISKAKPAPAPTIPIAAIPAKKRESVPPSPVPSVSGTAPEPSVATIPVSAPVPAAVPTTAPAPARSPVLASIPLRGKFGVQLGAVKSKTIADREAGRLNRTYEDILGAFKIVPVHADLGKRGIFYRLRAGPIGGTAAASLCRKLSARNQDCIVVKP